MLDTENKRRREQQKQKVKKRYNVTIDPENYKFIPAKKQTDYYDDDVNQRVAIYVRVSTDDVRQTTSYELQKKYYEEFVTRHPNWTLVNIYADACVIIGQTGQSLAATGFAPFWSYTDSFNSTEGDNRRKTNFAVGSALTLWSFMAKRDSRPATDAIRQLQGGRFAVGAIQLPFHITVMITLYAGS